MRDTGPLRAAKSDASKLNVLLLLLCVAGLTACGAGSQGASVASAPSGQDGQLRITIPASPATVGVAYNAAPSVSGGAAPYAFSIVDGSLPPGLVLNPSTGSITGIPSASGTYSFTLYASTLPGKQSGTPIPQFVSNPARGPIGVVPEEFGSTSTHIVVAARSSGAKLW